MVVQISWRLRKHINVKVLIPTVLACFVGRSAGVYILETQSTNVLKIVLGISLVILSVYLACFSSKINIKGTIRNGLTAGVFSGILGGMFNISGPPLVVYYFSAIKDKMEYNGTIQATFLISGLYSIILHIMLGNISFEVIKFTAAGAVAVTAGSSFGLWIMNRIRKDSLSKVIYSFMAVMGLFMLFNK
jgi:uncharacterized membrane protein YfcA